MDQDYSVITVVSTLYSLSVAESITDSETGKELTVKEFQDIVYQQVELLAELLDIKLEE